MISSMTTSAASISRDSSRSNPPGAPPRARRPRSFLPRSINLLNFINVSGVRHVPDHDIRVGGCLAIPSQPVMPHRLSKKRFGAQAEAQVQYLILLTPPPHTHNQLPQPS